jgi:serine/threonine-protein kinase
VLERIGGGAFGEVYRAWDTRLEREVALKLLASDDTAGEESAVIAEGSLLARVRHPNIVTVYGAERISGQVGLWMELIKGQTLEATLREQGPASAHEAAVVGLSVCRALSAVHHAGLLHRDVKAQNVMREAGGRIVLMDFGTGRQAADLRDGTRAGAAGTPLYLAPELFASGEASVQSDLYAAGVLLFHLVTGSFPVEARTLDELRDAHRTGRRRFLRDARPDLPEEFVAAVERAVAPESARRFETAGEMEAALARVVAGHPLPAARPGRHWVTALAVAVAAAAIVAVAAPKAWRARLPARLGGTAEVGGSAPSSPAPGAVAGLASSVVVRKVTLPDGWAVGRPSPDGRFFSFIDTQGDLALVELATGAIRQLTRHEADTDQYAGLSTVSTDGAFAAYTWHALDGGHELRVVGTDGKRPRVVLRSASISEPMPLEGSRDGRSVLCVLAHTDGRNQLALLDVEDGRVRVVRELGYDPPRHASVSPDGEWVVFDAPAGPRGARDIFVTRADGTEAHALVAHPAHDHVPVFSADGTRVVFASDRSGAMDVWSVRLAGGFPQGEPELLHRGVGRMWLLGLTDTGHYYYQVVTGAVEVYSAELSPRGAAAPATLGTSYAGSNISSVFSPDGRYAAWASRRGLVGFDRGSTTLVVRDLAAGTERELVPPLASFLLRSWSPDGRQVLASGRDRKERGGLFGIDVETGAAQPLVLDDAKNADAGHVGRGDWCADGRLLYHDRKRRALLLRDLQSRREEIALDMRAERIEVFSHNALLGRGFKLSPDGRTLAFTAQVKDGEGLAYSLRVKTGREPSRELLRVPAAQQLTLQEWVPEGDAVLVTRRGPPMAVWRVPLHAGEPAPLGVSMVGLRDVSLHPHGQRVTFTAGSPLLEVWVIESLLVPPRSARQ